MRVHVDQTRCGGVALCVREMPEVFRLMEGSKRADVRSERVAGSLARRLKDVAARCPYRAIEVLADEGHHGPKG